MQLHPVDEPRWIHGRYGIQSGLNDRYQMLWRIGPHLLSKKRSWISMPIYFSILLKNMWEEDLSRPRIEDNYLYFTIGYQKIDQYVVFVLSVPRFPDTFKKSIGREIVKKRLAKAVQIFKESKIAEFEAPIREQWITLHPDIPADRMQIHDIKEKIKSFHTKWKWTKRMAWTVIPKLPPEQMGP